MNKTYHNSIVIAPRELHGRYLRIRNEDPHLSFSWMTMEEAISLFDYQSDDRLLRKLLKSQSYERALIMASLLRSRNLSKLGDPDLNRLQEECLKEGLLYETVHPERTFKGKNILWEGYRNVDRFHRVLSEIDHNIALSPIGSGGNDCPTVHVFPDEYEELRYLFNRIAEDLSSGTKLDDIYLLGANEQYEDLLQDTAKRFGLMVEPLVRRRLYDERIYKRFREMASSLEIEEALKGLEEEFGEDRNLTKIQRIHVRFGDVFENIEALLDLYDQIAKATQPTMPIYQNVIKRLNGPYAPKGAHVYIIGFIMGAFPRVYREEIYPNDLTLKSLDMPTSAERSEEAKIAIEDLLRSGKVRSISYPRRSFGTSRFVSSLKAKLGLSEDSPNLPYEYSLTKGRFLTAALLDDKRNFDQVDPRLPGYWKHNPELKEKPAYDYQFHSAEPVISDGVRKYSPSSLKTYYVCPFKYYANYILNLSEFEPSFEMVVGKIFHGILQKYYQDGPSFDFDSSWDYLVEECRKEGKEPNASIREYSAMERLMLIRLKEECQRVLQFYKDFDLLLRPIKHHAEQWFSFPIAPNVVMNGQYDCIVEHAGPTGTRYFILDYKSGGERFQEAKLPYGLSVQLPFYCYFAMHDADFGKKELSGLFIGGILSSKNYTDNTKKTWSDIVRPEYRLNGLFLNDPNGLKETFNGDYVIGAKVKNDGTYSLPNKEGEMKRPRTKDEFEAIAEQAKELVLAADNAIRKGDFQVAPARWKGEQSPCGFCPYRDICFRLDDQSVRQLPPGTKSEDEDDADNQSDDGESDDE